MDARLEDIFNAVSQLEEPIDKQIIDWYLDGLTFREIGSLLNISHVAAYKKYNKIIEKIKKILKI